MICLGRSFLHRFLINMNDDYCSNNKPKEIEFFSYDTWKILKHFIMSLCNVLVGLRKLYNDLNVVTNDLNLTLTAFFNKKKQDMSSRTELKFVIFSLTPLRTWTKCEISSLP